MDGISEARNEASGSDPIDRAVVKKELTSSNHILSEAFRVIVEVPDPPAAASGFSEEDEEEEEEAEEKVSLFPTFLALCQKLNEDEDIMSQMA